MARHETATALVVAALVLAPATGRAQDVRKDTVWNGVVIGAAAGAIAGLVVAETTESICSARDCMILMAVAGGAAGLLMDKLVGAPEPVDPGSAIDDPLANGALVGAGAGAVTVLLDFARRCGTGPGKVACTSGGVFRAALRGALFSAAVGALVDAAIPSRAPTNSGAPAEALQRLSLTVGVRF